MDKKEDYVYCIRLKNQFGNIVKSNFITRKEFSEYFDKNLGIFAWEHFDITRVY